ncbi:MAG TPA: peptide deformylase [Candidatus Saccharimonadales bacterium]|nr:peptide deformylase [Candidatus Saccharimonadales bacterium]
MSDEVAPVDAPDEEGSPEPRIWITKGTPWTIDPSRRERWSTAAAVAEQAVEVRQVGDPVLHAPGKKPRMDRKELEVLVQRMFASMIAAHGVGIAAQQIGVPLRVVIIDVDEAGIVAVNPEIDWVSPEVEETSEGCLSVRGMYGMLERPLVARLSAVDLGGKRFTIEGEDMGAQCMLHETDHTNGVLYTDRLRLRTDLFTVGPDDPDEEHRSLSGHSRAQMERTTS